MKYAASAKAQIEAVDAVLGRGVLDAQATETLVEILGPKGCSGELELRVVLGVVEHPVVAAALRDGRVPEALVARLSEAIAGLTPLFGGWMAAPLAEQAQRLRQRYDAEARKFEMVSERVEKASMDAGARLIVRYLDTSPAPMFARRMEVAFGEAYERAEAIRGVEDQMLLANPELLELLAFGEGRGGEEATRLAELLDALVAELDDAVERVVRRTLETGRSSEAKLVAGALAARQGMIDRASGLLAMVIHGDPYAPQAAVFAARLAPVLSLHVLGQFLVDVLKSTGVEEDQERHTEGAIVAARKVLPWIGSPIPEAGYAARPSAQQVADQVQRAWDFFDRA